MTQADMSLLAHIVEIPLRLTILLSMRIVTLLDITPIAHAGTNALKTIIGIREIVIA